MAAKLSRRVSELESALSLTGMLASTLRYTMAPMEALVKRISAMGDMPDFVRVCTKCCEQGEAFPQAWEKALRQTPTSLDSDDQRALFHLGEVLGATDLEGALSELDYAEFLLKQRYEEAKARKKQLGGLYQTLGVLAGAAIVIVVI